MNHNHLIRPIIRSFIAYISLISMVSYGGGDEPLTMSNHARKRLGRVDFENQLDHVGYVYEQDNQMRTTDFLYEEHPLSMDKFKTLFADDNTKLSQLREIFEKPDSVWSMNGPYKVNNTCGEACLAALSGDHLRAKRFFKYADQQGSHWGAYGRGLYALCDFKIEDASDCFKRAFERDGHRIVRERGGGAPAPIQAYRDVMATIGFPSHGKCNIFSIMNQGIIRSSGKTIADLAYPLAVCAANSNDTYAQEMCLHEASKYRNQFTGRARGMLAGLRASKRQQESIPPTIAMQSAAPALPLPVEVQKNNDHKAQKTIAVKETSSATIPPQAPVSISSPAPEKRVMIPAQAPAAPVVIPSPAPATIPQASVVPSTAGDESGLIGLLRVDSDNDDDEENNRLAVQNALKMAERKPNKIACLEAQYGYGNADAALELSHHYAQNDEDKKAWERLHFAVQNDNVAAYPVLIERYLKSDVSERKKAAAECVNKLLSDPLLMEKAQLTDARKGALYATGGVYASTRDKKKAVDFLQQASALGNHEHAYLHGTMCFGLGHEEKSYYEKAATQFALVEGEARSQADMYREAIQVIKGDATKLPLILKRLTEDHARKAILKDILGNKDMQIVLASHQNNPYALMIIAHSAHEGLGKKPDQLLAYSCCVDMLTLLSHNQEKDDYKELQKECMGCLQSLSEEGCEDARKYLRKNYPLPEEQEVDELYNDSKRKIPADLSEEVIAILKKDVKTEAYKVNASYVLARYYHAQGKLSYKKSTQADTDALEKEYKKKAHDQYLQAIACLQVAVDNGSVQARNLMPSMSYDVAVVTENENFQHIMIKRAADDEKHPCPIACLSMMYYYQSKGNSELSTHYYKRACELEDPEAILLTIKNEFEAAQKAGAPLEPVCKRINDLRAKITPRAKNDTQVGQELDDSDDDHVAEVLKELEELAVRVSHAHSRGAPMNDLEVKITLHANCAMTEVFDAIRTDRYADAKCMMTNQPSKEDPYRNDYLLVKAYIEYMDDPTNRTKLIAALRLYEHSLRTACEKKSTDTTLKAFHDFVFVGLNEQKDSTKIDKNDKQAFAIQLGRLGVRVWRAQINNDKKKYVMEIHDLLTLASQNVENVGMVKKWYDLIPEEHLDEPGIRMTESFLHAHNAYKKSPEEGAAAFMKALTRSAELGYVPAKINLIQIFTMGATLNTGYVIKKDLSRAAQWAERVLEDPLAQQPEKLVAYSCLARRSKEIVRSAKEESEKRAAYERAKQYFELLIQAGELGEIAGYADLCVALGKDLKVENGISLGERDLHALCERYWHEEKIWSDYVTAVMMGGSIALENPKLLKRWIDEKLPTDIKTFKAQSEDQRFECTQIFQIVSDLCSDSSDPVLYGFKDATEKRAAGDKVQKIYLKTLKSMGGDVVIRRTTELLQAATLAALNKK